MSARRILPRLLVAHAAITGAASVVLVAAPGIIPGAIGIDLEPSAYLIVYLLASAELGFAVLSLAGARLTDLRALRAIVAACVVFHGASAVVEVLAIPSGVRPAVWLDVAARVGMAGVLLWAAPRRAGAVAGGGT